MANNYFFGCISQTDVFQMKCRQNEIPFNLLFPSQYFWNKVVFAINIINTHILLPQERIEPGYVGSRIGSWWSMCWDGVVTRSQVRDQLLMSLQCSFIFISSSSHWCAVLLLTRHCSISLNCHFTAKGFWKKQCFVISLASSRLQAYLSTSVFICCSFI